ncbi:hypothetical protein C2845_PM03G26190 [Panicum miliaceum]|uniref:MINDY deubiquitinase domain-containing protein n=1 Tax=Panicum miliaceum TaxID=4540 RepID=A0A3L6TEE6_PANMI|nr:hypothetical protein C2845_PM03G26190 [Panicum miliaceum]
MFLSSLDLSELADPDVAKKCKIVQDFLKEAKKLCTRYGYLKLCEMANGSFALYYWNKKLDVIHKNETYLLILETDQGVLDKLPGVTWRVFEEVDDGNSIYLASDYSLVGNQPNIAKAQLWFKDKGLSDNKEYSIEPAAGKRSDCQEDKAAVTQDGQGDEEQLSARQRKRRNKKLKKQAEEEEAGRKRAEEEDAGRKRAEEEEAARKQAEEEDAGRKRAEEEEAARKRAEEEDKAAVTQDGQGDEEQLSARQRKRRNKKLKKEAEEEEARRRRAEEEFAGRKRAEEEDAVRKRAEEEEAARKRAEEEEAGRNPAEEEEREKLSAICNDFEHFLLVEASVFISLIVWIISFFYWQICRIQEA